ncbi:MAG: hypothetical protein Q8M94_06765 [Ignavibacteria bacterium]|nr:hypothetical protein [Ignavibacteria bacterium]
MEGAISTALHTIPSLGLYYFGFEARSKLLFEFETRARKKHPKLMATLLKMNAEDILLSRSDEKVANRIKRDVLLVGYGIPIAIALLGIVGAAIGINSDNSILAVNSGIVALTHLSEVTINFISAVKKVNKL